MLSKDQIQTLVQNWNTHSIKEMETMLGVTKGQMSYIVTTLRKYGVPLEKKTIKSDFWTKEYIEELKQLYK